MFHSKRPSEDARAIRVVLVGQDERFRGTVRTALRRETGVYVEGEALEGTAAVAICILGEPDVVVVDALMPWHEASAVVARIHKARPTALIVVCRATSFE